MALQCRVKLLDGSDFLLDLEVCSINFDSCTRFGPLDNCMSLGRLYKDGRISMCVNVVTCFLYVELYVWCVLD